MELERGCVHEPVHVGCSIWRVGPRTALAAEEMCLLGQERSPVHSSMLSSALCGRCRADTVVLGEDTRLAKCSSVCLRKYT